MSEEEPKKSKYNSLRLLNYFQNKFLQTYKVAFSCNQGRDVKLMKQVKNLFEENPQLGDLITFIDMCFKENPSNQISVVYLKAVVNTRLGIQKKKKAASLTQKRHIDNTTAADWAAADEEWNNKLI